jgi:hypothetical protein
LVLAPVLGLTADVAFHLAASWLSGGRKLFASLAVGILGGTATALTVSWWALTHLDADPAERAAFLAFNFVTYLALAYGYAHFVNLQIASLRVRLLEELRSSPGGLTAEEILARYNARRLIDTRLDRLTARQQIVEKGGRFHGRAGALVVIAWGIDSLRWVVLGKRKEAPRPADG